VKEQSVISLDRSLSTLIPSRSLKGGGEGEKLGRGEGKSICMIVSLFQNLAAPSNEGGKEFHRGKKKKKKRKKGKKGETRPLGPIPAVADPPPALLMRKGGKDKKTFEGKEKKGREEREGHATELSIARSQCVGTQATRLQHVEGKKERGKRQRKKKKKRKRETRRGRGEQVLIALVMDTASFRSHDPGKKGRGRLAKGRKKKKGGK